MTAEDEATQRVLIDVATRSTPDRLGAAAALLSAGFACLAEEMGRGEAAASIRGVVDQVTSRGRN